MYGILSRMVSTNILKGLTCAAGFCRTPGDEVYPGKDEYGAE